MSAASTSPGVGLGTTRSAGEHRPSSIRPLDGLLEFLGSADEVKTRDLHAQLGDGGLIALRFTDPNLDSFRSWFAQHWDVIVHRHGAAGGVTVVAPSRQSAPPRARGMKGFTREGLLLHSDGPESKEPPSVVALLMVQPAPVGGASVLADGAMVLDRLECDAPDALDTLKQPGCVEWGTSGQRHPVVEARPGGLRLFRFYDEARPLNAEAVAALDTLAKYVAAASIEVDMREGDLLVIQNRRWLHGRRRFEGARVVLRLQGAMPSSTPDVGVNDGFRWADLAESSGML